ncbi:MAG TPA: zinc-ribbon domain-containing protein, partial [Paracoccaceae bacterium]|nr:zinc-ribbon domain-containing protein [Paracoccaceae bacterium]
MELICPACKTRYLVPDDAIPASGRQVSCTECHHGWQAFPPRIPGADSLEGAPQTPVSAESPGPGAAPAVARPSAPDAPQATARTFPSAEADAELADPARAAAEPGEDLVPRTEPRGEDTPDFPTGSEAPSYHPAPEASAASNRIRQQQLTEIRKMLAEVQSGHSRARASATGDPDAVLPPTEGAEEGAGKDGVTASTELRRDGASVPLDATKEPRKPKDATPRQADAEPGASDR